MDISDHFFDLPDGRIHYLDLGSGKPQIHFLHANGFCAGTYLPLLKHLANEFHIIASDIRGHGDSEFPNFRKVRHWRTMTQDLKMLIGQRMSFPIVGIGHSLGASITAMTAALYPHLFSAIILTDPVIFPTKRLWMIGMMRMLGMISLVPLARGARRRKRIFTDKQEALNRFNSGRGIFKSWTEDFVHSYLECALAIEDDETARLKCHPEIEAQFYETVPLNIWQYVRRIRCPILVLRGEHSDTFLKDAAARMKKALPQCRMETVADTGHFLLMEKPDICSKLMSEFIRECFIDKNISIELKSD